MDTLLLLLGFMYLSNKKDNIVPDVPDDSTDTTVDDPEPDPEPDTDLDPDSDPEPDDITEIEENTINGTTKQVYSYYRTQGKIKDLKSRADKLKQHTSDMLLKVKDNNNLSPEEKGFLRTQIVNTVDLKSAFAPRR